MNNAEIVAGLRAYAAGDWEKAHEIAQSQEGTWAFDRLHAFLHRAEGDAFNARYWYRSLKLEVPNYSLEQELEELLEEFSV
jgi:hypothetical protein